MTSKEFVAQIKARQVGAAEVGTRVLGALDGVEHSTAFMALAYAAVQLEHIATTRVPLNDWRAFFDVVLDSYRRTYDAGPSRAVVHEASETLQ